MASDDEFRQAVADYERTKLNRATPTFRVGKCRNIAKDWDRQRGGEGWEFVHEPGVYAFYDIDRKLIYVGKANDLENRTGSYFRRTSDDRVVETVHLWDPAPVFLQMVAVQDEIETHSLEAYLIKMLNPSVNKRGKSSG